MRDISTRRVLAKKIVAPPVREWSDWSGHKSTATVRADIIEYPFDTRGAERALVAANACFERVGRQRLGAVLAGWSKFEHAALFQSAGSAAFCLRSAASAHCLVSAYC